MQPKPKDFPKTWFSALVVKPIVWDNCEGSFTTMARPGDVIAVTYHGRQKRDPALPWEPSYSAHFVHGDVTISDHVRNSEIRLVSHAEGRRLKKQYDDDYADRLIEAAKRREEDAENDLFYGGFVDDFDDVDDVDDL